MKFNLFLITLLAGMLTWAPLSAQAETDSDSTEQVSKKDKKSKKAKKGKKKAVDKAEEDDEQPAVESKVGAILKKNTYFNNPEPNFNAEYFIFLRSASWCGPCNREMPEVVEAYKLMKESGKVELILESYDQTQDAAKNWFDKFGAKFPAVMRGASLPEMPAASGIPHAVIMKADGTIIKEGHGSIIRSWKSQTIGEYAVLGDDGEPRVGKALKPLKFSNGKPSAKAKMYFYYYAPDIAAVNKDHLTKVASEYKDMKKGKMELIFITASKAPAEVTKLMRSCKAKFPVTQVTDEVKELPGIGKLGTEPQVWVVTQSGASVTSGALHVATDWQKILDANK